MVKTARTGAALSAAEVAGALGMSVEKLLAIEDGRHDLRLADALRLVEVCDLDLDELRRVASSEQA